MVSEDDDASEPTDLSAFTDAADSSGNADSASDGDSSPDNDSSATASDDSASDSTDTDISEKIAAGDADRPRAETVELGVELLAHLEDDELDLPEAMDRIETITTDPTVSRDILDTAETRGIIERDGATIRTRTGGIEIEFERQVVRRTGEYDCKRCGKGLSTGHFVQFETGEVGPFGSSCIQKVTGRE